MMGMGKGGGPKGLALIMSAKKKGSPDSEETPEGEDPTDDSGGSEMEFAKIAIDAAHSGDTEAGAEALVKAIKACMSSYGGGGEKE
jgi:hypothetical protein